MIYKRVRETILKNDLLRKGDYVIIGLSGGPDSVCLFLMLTELKEEFGLNISAVHVNHMLRPIEAGKDQRYVEDLCKNLKIPCETVVCDCTKTAKERGLTDEEAGRNIRYEAFYEAAHKLIKSGISPGKIKIAVAQNKNDQAETLLMRIMRGTGVNGLSGIEYKRMGENGTHVIRPLLDIDRIDIEKYCELKNAKPRLDHTNEQSIYTRNKIRLELLPYITENFNENIVDALARLTQSAKEDNVFLWEQAEAAYTKAKQELGGLFFEELINAEKADVLNRATLRMLNSALRKRVILIAFRKIGLNQNISAPHFDMIDNIILSEHASAKVNLPSGYEMLVSYENVAAVKYSDDNFNNTNMHLLVSNKIMDILDYNLHYGEKIPGKQIYMAAFDYERLKGTAKNAKNAIVVRCREQGDYFTPNGMKSGRKKVQDYFVDRKIPKESRDFYRLAALGKEILWVFDPVHSKHNEVNENYKVTKNTTQVLLLEVKREL